MAIIAGNYVVQPVPPVTTPAPLVQPVSPVVEVQNNVQQQARPAPQQVQGVAASPNEAVLVVNGRQKRIGRKSRYLLDMLSLDE